jgi:hypothetical protein
MVTQESGRSSNEGGEEQRRKSLAAAAIRRGDIKISEPQPILWVEGVPDASTAEHTVSSSVPPEEVGTSEPPPNRDEIHGVAVSTYEEQPESKPIGGTPTLRPKRSSHQIRKTPESKRGSTSSGQLTNQRNSTILGSLESSNQMQAKKKRRSGTIRTVIRKVFGRRDKSNSKHISPPQSRAGPKHEYTRSVSFSDQLKRKYQMSNGQQDPLPNMNSTAREKDKQAKHSFQTDHQQDPLRSQPVEDHKPRTPVPASFLPFPMNVNAPESSPSQKALNYVSFETSPRVHRRRATLPSMMLSPADAAVLQKMWSSPDLQPLPPSPSKSVNHSMPNPLIGVAVTSGANPNRRSRSAGALHEIARLQAETAGQRRRSSEIRYWRTSQIDPHDVRGPASRQSSDCKSTRGSTANSDTELSDAMAETGSSIRGGPHSFDFGSNTTEPNTAEKSGHIVEQRLSQLEFNMQHISLSLQQYSIQQPQRKPVIIDQAPPRHQSQKSLTAERPGLPANPKDTFPTRTNSKSFTQTSRPPTAPSHSSSPSTVSQHQVNYTSSPSPVGASPPTAFMATEGGKLRPSTSATTPQPAQTSLTQTIHDHLAPLYNALRYERTVRKALEAQVLQLRQDVDELSTIVSQLRGATYPTPSPDNFMSSTMGSTSAEKSRFSGYDSDDEGKGFGSAEKWATPREELGPRDWGHSSEHVKEGHMF